MFDWGFLADLVVIALQLILHILNAHNYKLMKDQFTYTMESGALSQWYSSWEGDTVTQGGLHWHQPQPSIGTHHLTNHFVSIVGWQQIWDIKRNS